MQATTQVVCPKPTDAQIQAQIENMHWQEKQQEQANQFNRQMETTRYQMEQSQAAVRHTEYMIEHLSIPCTLASVALIAAFVITKTHHTSTQADIQKNRDDNESDVRYAQHLIDKHEDS